jgi:hypothetical protein
MRNLKKHHDPMLPSSDIIGLLVVNKAVKLKKLTIMLS